jgi:DNA-binding transcriptional regulator GbsR (MarR family)
VSCSSHSPANAGPEPICYIFACFFLAVPEFSVFIENVSRESEKLKQARDEFVGQWGALGTQWGINRTMAQIHALLMTAPQPLTTDEVMEELEISRGNAHSNLKELVAWGLLRSVVKKGERREFFEAEKDVWQIFTIVARERKRREIEPALAILSKCAEESRDIQTPDGKAFYEQMRALEDFVGFASKMSDRISSMKHGFALQMAAKLLG